ncbi:hypothetical protein ASH00_16180 [Arthrobacter sp. Soil782]|uniref:hypothetical protein n=1 Tax=Arthrobacter sp. Soil782 TaxID=1736410 RepID=UPI0006FA6164|nr:hypothetical protein [Arthrobacter sp. Soil782]KRF07081.1 hypothetical protein ASH00_16180 [Arthrobacter sp. Soil782]
MLDALQNFTESMPSYLQWLGVIVAGAIPFIESYFGAVIGVMAGMNTATAIAAAVTGNIATMLAMVLGAHTVRSRFGRPAAEASPKRRRLREAFDKYGIAGVSLLGQTILPSQITSAALVSFGAPKNKVIFWQLISIILWGTAFGLLAAVGVDLIVDDQA